MLMIDNEKLFVGSPINFYDICLIYPIKINDILSLGKITYNYQINLLTMTERDMRKMLEKKKISEEDEIYSLSIFEYLMESGKNNSNFLLDLEKAFFTFIREKISILPDLGYVVIGDFKDKRIIDKNNFEDFQDIIRISNHIPIPERSPEDESPMAKKFRLRREAVEEAKRKKAEKEGTNLELEDLIECLCAYGIGFTPKNIGDLTIYALYKLLNRLQKKEQYELDIRMLLAGADSKKVKPKNWIIKS